MADLRTAHRAPRGKPLSMSARQLDAYLLARDTLRRLRAAAPPGATPPPRPHA